MDMLIRIVQKTGAAPFLSKPFMDLLADRPSPPPVIFPDPAFTGAITDKHGRRMPQAISHRGYKAKFPENSLLAFSEAVKAGTHAVETDVHLTRDNVVVLSHDASLKRCFGVDKTLLGCDWEYIKTLQTLAEPRVPLARLDELLHWLAEAPEAQHLWVLLDIKLDNKADDIMRYMSETFATVTPSKGRPWEERIVLGCWAASYIPLCHQYFPGFPVSNIGFSVSYARQFLPVQNLSFNMLQASLVSPFGRSFIRTVKKRNRKIYSWTVNETKGMDWCIRKGLDGVISDDPAQFLAVCEEFDAKRKPRWPVALALKMMQINMMVMLFSVVFWYKHGYGLDPAYNHDKAK